MPSKNSYILTIKAFVSEHESVRVGGADTTYNQNEIREEQQYLHKAYLG
jgi:hypothetical protein